MNAWHDRASAETVGAALTEIIGLRSTILAERAVILHDLAAMRDRFELLRDVFPSPTLHAIAIKANPLVEVLRVLVGLGAGLEAASIEEIHVALAADCPPERIVFDSPAKTHDELRFALQRGMTVNVDNLDELSRALDIAPHPSARIGVRVRPDVEEGSIAATSVGGVDSRFGVSATDVIDHVVPLMRRHQHLGGLHVHVGSQGVQLDQLVAAARVAAELIQRVEAATELGRVSYVDLGGGLPASYGEQPGAPAIDDYVGALRQAVPDLMAGHHQLITEFGRSLLAACGSAISRVEYVKAVGDQPVAVIHLGADFLLRPAYRPDQWHHRFSVLDADGHPKPGPTRPWTIAGPLCFAGDIIGREVELPDIVPGDLLVIHDVGAYTLSMWSRHCSRGLPLVLGYDRLDSPDAQLRVLREAERPEDVARFWSGPTSPP